MKNVGALCHPSLNLSLFRALADKQVPQACLLFAHQKKDDLANKRLLHNFISHLIYMCDIGLVTPSTLTEVTRFLYNDNPSKI